MSFETFSGGPTFTVANNGDGDSVDFTITHPTTHTGFQYSRIYQTTDISTNPTVAVSFISSSSYNLPNLNDNTYYYFAMDSIVTDSGTGVLEDGPITGFKKVLVTSTSATSQMQLPRLSALSLVYYLRDSFENISWYPSQINIDDGYPEDLRKLVLRRDFTSEEKQRKLPCVTVELISINRAPLEFGNNDAMATYRFSIDIFAGRDGQKEDIAYLCQKYLNDQYISILDYNEGFPPVTGQTITGKMQVINMSQVNTSNKASPIVAQRHSCRLICDATVIESY